MISGLNYSPTLAAMNSHMRNVKIIPAIRGGQFFYLPTKILFLFNLRRLLALSFSVYPAFRLPAIVKLPRLHLQFTCTRDDSVVFSRLEELVCATIHPK